MIETNSEFCSLNAERREAFKLFVVSIMGLTSGTADSYLAYVNGLSRSVKQNPDEIVRSTEQMSAALAALDKTGLNASTRRNFRAGIKAYYRFQNRSDYKEDVRSETSTQFDIPAELRSQLNELELKASDAKATFWHKICDASFLVFTVVPAILAITGTSRAVTVVALSAMAVGLLCIIAIVPVLWRPYRLISELYSYGRSVANGEATVPECIPNESTRGEKVGEILMMILLPTAFVLLFVAVLLIALKAA